jgi:2-dehydro-3-deoxyphosphogluconate aldolase/(4S)-4-hydroxy-2-oxoglutarate aldolase
MDKRTEITAAIKSQGLLPLYFHPDAETSIGVLKALYDAGCRAVEYTNRGEQALKNFERLRKTCDATMQGIAIRHSIDKIISRESAGSFFYAINQRNFSGIAIYAHRRC